MVYIQVFLLVIQGFFYFKVGNDRLLIEIVELLIGVSAEVLELINGKDTKNLTAARNNERILEEEGVLDSRAADGTARDQRAIAFDQNTSITERHFPNRDISVDGASENGGASVDD